MVIIAVTVVIIPIAIGLNRLKIFKDSSSNCFEVIVITKLVAIVKFVIVMLYSSINPIHSLPEQ